MKEKYVGKLKLRDDENRTKTMIFQSGTHSKSGDIFLENIRTLCPTFCLKRFAIELGVVFMIQWQYSHIRNEFWCQAEKTVLLMWFEKQTSI